MTVVDYDVERETEFNRVQLGTTIPKRLQELREILGGCSSLDAWHVGLLNKLLESVNRVCRDLLNTIGQEALPAAAWNARNLLELWVWIKYCSASRENARRFHEDALRDVQGLTDSLSKMCELRGIQNQFEQTARKKIAEVALSELGLQSIDSNFIQVSQAAANVGLDKWFSACNKHLSKFAHPTAGLVLGIMHQNERLRDLQSVCTTQGLYFAGQCVISLEETIRAVPNPLCAHGRP